MLNATERAEMLRQCRRALVDAAHGQRRPADLEGLDGALLEPAATFSTLTKRGRLRGCIGRLEAARPLLEDAVANTIAAALDDPRFPPVRPEEVDEIEIEIAVLSPPEPLDVSSRAELEAALRPRVDGLIIEDGRHRATFLPKVWEQLPERQVFIDELLMKAGLPPGHWSPNTRAFRYTVTEYPESRGA